MNERVTEDFVRGHFKNDTLFATIKFDEQSTNVKKAKDILKKASKQGTEKPGYPEFIITFPALPDNIIVIECKADTNFHESVTKSKPKEYAVDGALHYAKALSSEYNVIAIAVSGSDEKLFKTSSFYFKKGDIEFQEKDNNLLSVYSYISFFEGEYIATKIEQEEITQVAIFLNKEFQHYSIPEYERITIVSGILLALQNKAFCEAYISHAHTIKKNKEIIPTPGRLVKAILASINNVLQDNNIDQSRIEIMQSEYSRINNQTISLEKKIKKKKVNKYSDNYVLRDIVKKLEQSVLPLVNMGDKGYDVLGKFYTEFIRYAGTDKKTGLVLTPQHITDLFCDLVQLNKNDIVIDICCGTGGFLVAAMKYMLEISGSDEELKHSIKQKQLIGIEKRPDMFTFACSNMMMSGDGKSHVYQGDSFSNEIKNLIFSKEELKPTVAFLNPPYDVGEDGQLNFIKNALTYLQPGGRCAAICQMSTVVSLKKIAVTMRGKLLDKHTVEAVLSMPNEVFYPVGVVTCVIILTAHNPHPNDREVFFGYFKDDGFIKKKKKGRVDYLNKWDEIREQWINAYQNKKAISNLSLTRKVKAGDEWCAEAYMEGVDLSLSENEGLVNAIREYIGHRFIKGEINSVNNSIYKEIKNPDYSERFFSSYTMNDIFNISLGKPVHSDKLETGTIPYITRTAINNGVESYGMSDFINDGNAITIGAEGFKAFYQFNNFITGNKITIIRHNKLNKYSALFLCYILNCTIEGRYNYGYAAISSRLKRLSIKLPSDNEGKPDWQFMEDYIKSLPYSKKI